MSNLILQSTIFLENKSRITQISYHSGMTCCPFHHDKHPSLKLNEEYFFCFSCGATGDVIGIVARMFDLSGYEATQALTADFGISTEPG